MTAVDTTRKSRAWPIRTGGRAPLRGLLPLALGLVLWQIFALTDSPYFPPPRNGSARSNGWRRRGGCGPPFR